MFIKDLSNAPEKPPRYIAKNLYLISKRPVQTDCIKLSWIESFLTQFSLCTLCKATYSTAFKAVRMNMA